MVRIFGHFWRFFMFQTNHKKIFFFPLKQISKSCSSKKKFTSGKNWHKHNLQIFSLVRPSNFDKNSIPTFRRGGVKLILLIYTRKLNINPPPPHTHWPHTLYHCKISKKKLNFKFFVLQIYVLFGGAQNDSHHLYQ